MPVAIPHQEPTRGLPWRLTFRGVRSGNALPGSKQGQTPRIVPPKSPAFGGAFLLLPFSALPLSGHHEKSEISPISLRESVAATCFTLTRKSRMGIFEAPIISPLFIAFRFYHYLVVLYFFCLGTPEKPEPRPMKFLIQQWLSGDRGDEMAVFRGFLYWLLTSRLAYLWLSSFLASLSAW